mgnify:CR=1 FL=1
MRSVLALLLLVALPAQAGTREERSLLPQQISSWDERTGLLVASAWGPADIGRSTVEVTRDGGRTWSVMRAFSSKVEISAVPGTRTAFAATPTGLFRTRDAGASWVGISRRALEKPSFATPLVGWAMELTTIVATRDGGRRWAALRAPCTKAANIEIALTTAARGWAVCGFRPGAGQQPKEVWSTRDGGATWRLLNRASPAGRTVGQGLCVCGYSDGIAMTAGSAGWLWTTRGSFYRTGDGGRTWSSLPISSPDLVEGRSASLVSDRVGYALFAYRPALRLTRDGGRTWTVVRRWSS